MAAHTAYCIALSLTVVLVFAISVGCAAAEPADKRLGVYWVDVEGGGALLIVTPARESVLIDTGMDGDRDPGRIAAVARDVAGLKQIDHLVVTHFDIDHHGGAAEVHKRIPISHVYDPGPPNGTPQAGYDKYVAFRKTVPYTVLKPGDAIPLRQTEGTSALSLTCLAAAQAFIAPAKDARPTSLPADLPEYPVDKSENAHSIVLLLRFGGFEFLHTADLTGRLEIKLVSPVNLVGEVDVFQVAHHGLDLSNNPALVRAIQPTVTVMPNGHRKGCQARVRAALKGVPSIQANYQLHKNLAPKADSTSEELIANTAPAETCKGNHIELHAAPDGSSYEVAIPATGHKRQFRTR